MLEQQPTSYGTAWLQGRVVKQPAVQEICINRSQNEPSAREQFSQVRVTRIGKIRHVVIAMYDQYQGKRPRPFRIPYPCIQRQLVDVESPIFLACPALPALEILEKIRRIQCSRSQRNARGVFRPPNIVPYSIKKLLHVIRST